VTVDEIRMLLEPPPAADTPALFGELGVDSWSLIELRASLEARWNRTISGDDWVSISCPNDVVLLCQ
jgi:acyl carrier protein